MTLFWLFFSRSNVDYIAKIDVRFGFSFSPIVFTFKILIYFENGSDETKHNLFGHFCSVCLCCICICCTNAVQLQKSEKKNPTETSRKMVHETKSNDLCVFSFFHSRCTCLATTLNMPCRFTQYRVPTSIYFIPVSIQGRDPFIRRTDASFSDQFIGQLIVEISMQYIYFICLCMAIIRCSRARLYR